VQKRTGTIRSDGINKYFLSFLSVLMASVRELNCHTVYGSTALCWVLAAFSVSWSFTQSVVLFWGGISPSQGRYLHTQDSTHTEETHTDIHALSRICIHDSSVWEGENSSCLRTRGHCGRHKSVICYFENRELKPIRTGITYKVMSFIPVFVTTGHVV
jgi:hypothetical protein